MYAVGQLVEKYTGDYGWPGIVCSAFRTPDGNERYVVAHPAPTGYVLHIYSEINLRPCEFIGLDFVRYLTDQREWSLKTFGPGPRVGGIIEHIRKELIEIEKDPTDVTEWLDVAILALDGAWRAGYSPLQVAQAFLAKQKKNIARVWPDWRLFGQNKAIEHDRSGE
jgi:hypothetical protein